MFDLLPSVKTGGFFAKYIYLKIYNIISYNYYFYCHIDSYIL